MSTSAASPDHERHSRAVAAQRGRQAALPDPLPLLENLTRCVIEVLGGARELDQISRWISDDVYRSLLKRVVLASRARRAKGRPTHRLPFTIGNTVLSETEPGVVEAVVMVHSKVRSRAVAIRLEAMEGRWRASAITVL